MSQHDYDIADQNGVSFLADLGQLLPAIASQNSGATEPSNTYAYMVWADTGSGYLRQRNGANTGWVNKFKLSQAYNNVENTTDANKPISVQVQAGFDELQSSIDELFSTLRAIGEPFEVWDHIIGCPIPSNSGSVKYIKLTAGEDGAGEYNEDLLVSELISGSSPDVIATALIGLVDSPMNGESVNLINTERRVMRAGGSGVAQSDAIRNIKGDIGSVVHYISGTGPISNSTVRQSIDGSGGSGLHDVKFDASLQVPTANENRMKNIGATYYMRIA